MKLRVALTALVVSLTVATTVFADITIVDEDFESYNNDTELYEVWMPDGTDEGVLTTDSELFPDIEGQAVDHLGGPVNQYGMPLSETGSILPSATQNILLAGDLFDNAWGNKRMSIGLRYLDPIENFLELGYWNTDVAGGYSFRMALFGVGSPNWVQITNFTDEAKEMWDAPGDMDGIVTPGEVGAGWHRYSATISETSVTIELDLFRDDVIDATEVVEMGPRPIGFNSLRIGGPSGVTSAGSSGLGAPPMNGGVAFDNILLKFVDIVTEGLAGDYNDSGRVEQGDLDLALLNWGVDTPPVPDGWVNDLPEGQIDQAELDKVLLNWGNVAPAAAAVPEPSTAIMTLLLLGVTGTIGRADRLTSRRDDDIPMADL